MIVPEGIVSTGWPAVRNTLKPLGISFDDWQQGATQLILSKDADGNYTTTVGGITISIPRQVGKTFLIGWIVFALCIIHPGLTVIWTAHRMSTADETFGDMKSMAWTPRVSGHIERTPDNGAEQVIEFKNGSRIIFGARERGFGRGFTEVDVVVFDEAQILTERAIDDMIPAQNSAKNALTIMIGTPPKPSDPSEVFEEARRAALAGDIPDSLYIEFSADRDADPDDRAQWRKANPSYPYRTNEAAMLRMRRRLSEESFMREAMGVWDEVSALSSAIPAAEWGRRRIESPSEDWPLAAVGIDMNPERTKVTLAMAAFSEDGIHAEIAADAPFDEAGTSALVDWVWERARRRVPVVIDAFSPARSLETPLKKRGMKVFILSTAEFTQACALLHDAAVKDKTLTHIDQEQLNASVAGTFKEKVGKAGAWKFNRSSLDVDLGPVMSVTCAHFGALKFARRRRPDSERKQRHAIVG